MYIVFTIHVIINIEIKSIFAHQVDNGQYSEGDQ